jgi:hypothetical protein
MQTYEILVRNRSVIPNSDDMSLVRTSIGIDQVHVLFDSAEWLGFPVKVTFAQGEDIVTQSLVLNEVTNSDEWSAESTVTVPYEVIDMVGPIRVTFQGTDSSGNHIITAYGTPLEVEEAGDVVDGTAPADAPTIDQWQQAYADAMNAVNQAAGVVSNLRDQLDAMVAQAETSLDETIAQAATSVVVPATRERLGTVIVGSGLAVTDAGVLSVDSSYELTAETISAVANLSSLAYYAFDTSFDEDGVLSEDVSVKPSALPIMTAETLGAAKVDGTTITVSEDGTISVNIPIVDETGF